MRYRIVRSVSLALLVSVGTAGFGYAQMVGPREATRSQLEARLDAIRDELQSVRDRDERERLQADMEALEHRLENGDLYPRDLIVLSVQGQQEWSDTFSVNPQREIELPRLDPMSVDGVLYSEVEPLLEEELGKYLRQPRIRAQALKRVAVLGEVGSPGFYNVPGSMLVSEAIMRAGGPTRRADVEKTQLRSFGQRLAEDRGRNLPAQGISLDHLGVTSGDEIYVPERRRFNIRNIAWGLGATATLIGLLTRVF